MEKKARKREKSDVIIMQGLLDDTNVIKLNRSQTKLRVDNNRESESSISLASGRSLTTLDYWNIMVLIFLYILQGVPLGLGASIPYLLQARKISYKEQAIFSLINWPFSMKLLWAPFVDSLYSKRIGRRKSWLVPVQFLIGITMYFLSFRIHHWMGDDGTEIKTFFLTGIFFFFTFLAATQDVVVDGWALTMLGNNMGSWVSTCNTVGQTIGFFLGNIVFLALESQEFSNSFLRSEEMKGGVISFSGFLYFWSIVFVVATILVMIFKRENDEIFYENSTVILQVYKILWKILRMPPVVTLCFLLLTLKIGFAAADSITALKLIEQGMPKDTMAMMAVPLIPIHIIVPIIITRHSNTKRPLDLLLFAVPIRLILGFCFLPMVSIATYVREIDSKGVFRFPYYYYIIILTFIVIHQISVCCIFVPLTSFFANISDPTIGGTYMTLLNTLSNLGGIWPQTVALWLVEYLEIPGCLVGTSCQFNFFSYCSNLCTFIDGFTIESIFCFIFGFFWLFKFKSKFRRLQRLSLSAWSPFTNS